MGSAGEAARRVRAGVHVLPAADLRALPEPLVRGLVPVGGDVQARGGRDRARRSGQVPRLALLRVGLPVQEGVLQPPHRQGREVHALLPADRGRPADDLLGDVRRADPLPRNRALRRRPGRGGRVDARPQAAARGPARGVPRPVRRRRSAAGLPRRDPRRLDRRRAPLAGVRARAPLPGRAAAAPRVPDAADGLVRAAALPDRQRARDRRVRGRPRRRVPGDRRDADPRRVPREPARRGRQRGDPRGAAPAGGDARPHAKARGARRARRGDRRRRRDDRRRTSRTCTGCWRSASTRSAT